MSELEGDRVLLTGGAGFIGSHTAVTLLEAGCRVTIVDDLSNSSSEVVPRLKQIVGAAAEDNLSFYQLDVRETEALKQILEQHDIQVVIHFAGLKAVGESVAQPLRYYETNIGATTSLLHAMQAARVTRLLFSSSATVYGQVAAPPYCETDQVDIHGIPHAYGQSKLMIEELLINFQRVHPEWDISLLRYFNPVGAHPSGLIGEDPRGIPNNLMPYITRVAVGKLEKLTVFGDDYPTEDGTPLRDYLHVCDLAEGHVAALAGMQTGGVSGLEIFNLGSGKPHSVLEVIDAFKNASGCEIPYIVGERRSGDLPAMYATPDKAQRGLSWQATRSLNEMCADSWRWQSNNPDGYDTAS